MQRPTTARIVFIVVYVAVTVAALIFLFQDSLLGDALIFLAAMLGFLYYWGSRRGWFD